MNNKDVKLTPPTGLTPAQKAQWDAAYEPKIKAFKEANLQGKDLVRWKYQRYMHDYLACIASVDESVGRVLDYLDQAGLADNTIVIYTSDQGFYLGEHGWFDKRFMYEESLRMPFVCRLPGRIRPGAVNTDIVSNLDFAPTFLDAAGRGKPAAMQGRSFWPLLLGRTVAGWPDSFYYHYYEFPAVHMVKRHYGVRTKRYKLIHFYYDIDAWELYDLEKDPLETSNVFGDPAYAGVRRGLEAELRRLQALYRDSDDLAREFVHKDTGR
jgi:arylsulfatase A-like enzyme